MARIPAKEVAKLARATLKAEFPGVKFSVRTEHGTTLRVAWVDGPSRKAVESKVSQYAGQGFDGMQDMRYYHDNDYGTDFVFCEREVSDEAKASLQAEIAASLLESDGVVWEPGMYRHGLVPQIIYRELDSGPWGQDMYSWVRLLSEARAEKEYAK